MRKQPARNDQAALPRSAGGISSAALLCVVMELLLLPLSLDSLRRSGLFSLKSSLLSASCWRACTRECAFEVAISCEASAPRAGDMSRCRMELAVNPEVFHLVAAVNTMTEELD